jgi:hypothetical protein
MVDKRQCLRVERGQQNTTDDDAGFRPIRAFLFVFSRKLYFPADPHRIGVGILQSTVVVHFLSAK